VDLVAYLYGVLAHPAFTAEFTAELATRELRVPLTKEPVLFEGARGIGGRLIWLHTFGQRMVPPAQRIGDLPQGRALCTHQIPDDAEHYPGGFSHDPDRHALCVGGGEFSPVGDAVYGFEVSGFKVLPSWLKYRTGGGGGRHSSVLDEIRPARWTAAMTTELLQLLWVLEATVDGYEGQAELLKAIIAGECYESSELPEVPDSSRRAPQQPVGDTLFDLGS
jgi:hypothetical protein